jgi:hypothetical protein
MPATSSQTGPVSSGQKISPSHIIRPRPTPCIISAPVGFFRQIIVLLLFTPAAANVGARTRIFDLHVLSKPKTLALEIICSWRNIFSLLAIHYRRAFFNFGQLSPYQAEGWRKRGR